MFYITYTRTDGHRQMVVNNKLFEESHLFFISAGDKKKKLNKRKEEMIQRK